MVGGYRVSLSFLLHSVSPTVEGWGVEVRKHLGATQGACLDAGSWAPLPWNAWGGPSCFAF